ncbi:MAG: tRNA (adenosine(37)-N6)-dimethylallyltransferase MiaA [Thermoguttaceae bacterium]|nr:tRNA (adenosine(37)-N6)-dimethylallyltransferase MiaA [Thermoguttaceae bacterium]
MESPIYYIVGPTASGKTQIGIALAKRLRGEILSLDSIAVYRGMDIGTAKPTASQQAEVPHHLIDIADPFTLFDVARYVTMAEAKIAEIRSRGHTPIFVGGTPMYLKALLYGIFDGPPANLALRAEIQRELESLTPQAAHQQLAMVDPVTATRLHPNDLRRIVRAIEVYRLTGRPISSFQTQWNRRPTAQETLPLDPASTLATPRPSPSTTEPMAGTLSAEESIGELLATQSTSTANLPHTKIPQNKSLIGFGENRENMQNKKVFLIAWDREILYERINQRVLQMFNAGLVEETRRLLADPRGLGRTAAQALGYREVIDYLSGQISHAQAIELTQTHTRQFAKRQLTFLRSFPASDLQILEMHEPFDAAVTAERILSISR